MGCIVVLVDVQLLGSIYWIGLTFNTATSIVLLLAVGIAVDYAAFMAFSFLNQVRWGGGWEGRREAGGRRGR